MKVCSNTISLHKVHSKRLLVLSWRTEKSKKKKVKEKKKEATANGVDSLFKRSSPYLVVAGTYGREVVDYVIIIAGKNRKIPAAATPRLWGTAPRNTEIRFFLFLSFFLHQNEFDFPLSTLHVGQLVVSVS